MPTVLLAPDKFKGTLTAAEVCTAVEAGLRRHRPDLRVVTVPVADGGDGTVAAALAAGYERVPVTASGPTGEPVRTAYARQGTTAVVEMADVSGLIRLVDGPAPLTASSRGTGEVMAAAIDAGCLHLVLGIGGSACTDGGAGMVAALGARLADAAGRVLPDGGAALANLAHVDLGGLAARLETVQVTVACDVDNPLLGERGAAAVYGPQKGATPADVTRLDAALGHWADLVETATGRDYRDHPGAGAAGGVGFAALALAGAQLRPGIDLVLELVGFREQLRGTDLVVTGEGSLDEQTLRGKAPAGVAEEAMAAGIPLVAVCGQNTLDRETLRDAGFRQVYALTDLEQDLTRCLSEGATLLEQLGERIAVEQLATA